MKYVLVSGGVISGIGKGILASSTGLLLRSLGLSTSYIKIDPYLNVDAGTMSPDEHGEVFVTDDGGETDLDIGNVERYLDITLLRDNNITTGRIYQKVINRERKGDYLGRTVQVVPHITQAIQDWIAEVARVPVDSTGREPDVCIIELGGTVGDIESAPFNEALRQLRLRTEEAEQNSFLHMFVSLLPKVGSELKTKPTQAAVRDTRGVGLTPDIIACRCPSTLEQATIDKIAMFCQVKARQVLSVHDVDSTYLVPSVLEKQGLHNILRDGLGLDSLEISAKLKDRGNAIWSEWKLLTGVTDQLFSEVRIALVNKYDLRDAFLSVIKALEHAAMRCRKRLNLIWVNSSHLESKTSDTSPADYHQAWLTVSTANGILVPGGFGQRGSEGMMEAIKYARTNQLPFLGICFGMQLAVVEFARNVLGIQGATSSEFDSKAKDTVIIPMEELDKEYMGGSMRLGLKKTLLEPDTEWSKIRGIYARTGSLLESNATGRDDSKPQSNVPANAASVILERHRHRYEVNPAYIEKMREHGLEFIGKDELGIRMEVIELRSHPFFAGVQYHPEFLSRVLHPSPPILGFFAASAGCLDEILAQPQSQQIGPALGAGHRDSVGALADGIGQVRV